MHRGFGGPLVQNRKSCKTHRFSSRKFDTPVALRGPRNPNGEDLSREIVVFFASRAKIRISWQKFVTPVALRGLRNSINCVV